MEGNKDSKERVHSSYCGDQLGLSPSGNLLSNFVEQPSASFSRMMMRQSVASVTSISPLSANDYPWKPSKLSTSTLRAMLLLQLTSPLYHYRHHFFLPDFPTQLSCLFFLFGSCVEFKWKEMEWEVPITHSLRQEKELCGRFLLPPVQSV